MPAPINTQDAAACGAAYTGLLGWPVLPGHRYRPRGGCTCEAAADCREAGAHPRPGPLTSSPGSGLAAELNAAPGAGLIAPCASFDAIVLPRQLGMAAMVSLDRIAPVPCLVTDSRAVLLVLPSTGRYALPGLVHGEDAEIRAGVEQWIALPPSRGVRWDTPPWNEQTHRPLPLLHGQDLRPQLHDALRVHAGARTPAQPR